MYIKDGMIHNDVFSYPGSRQSNHNINNVRKTAANAVDNQTFMKLNQLNWHLYRKTTMINHHATFQATILTILVI